MKLLYLPGRPVGSAIAEKVGFAFNLFVHSFADDDEFAVRQLALSEPNAFKRHAETINCCGKHQCGTIERRLRPVRRRRVLVSIRKTPRVPTATWSMFQFSPPGKS